MKKKIILVVSMVLSLCLLLNSCGIEMFNSKVNDIKGQLTGVGFNCYFYDNNANKYLTVNGDKIGITNNIVQDIEVNNKNGGTSDVYSLSSVITINIDGKQIQSCGDTVIFEENGLKPNVEFELKDINSHSDGKLSDNTYISNIINKYKNMFGKPQVVVIQSQLGVPICAYSGESVYWQIKDDLPKTTKLSIDGKALYIHRANFQIIDLSLIK